MVIEFGVLVVLESPSQPPSGGEPQIRSELRIGLQGQTFGGFACGMKTSKKPERGSAPNDQTIEVMADWKDVDGLLRQLRRALRVLGVEMRPNPATKRTDVYGFLLRRSRTTSRHRGS